ERIADCTISAFTLRLATCRLAVSEQARRYVESIYAGTCEVLPNGVDTRRFRSAWVGERTRLRESFGLPENGAIVLSVRRPTLKNGIETLVQAEGLVPHVHFALAGSGPDRQKVDRLIQVRRLRNITLLGFVPD